MRACGERNGNSKLTDADVLSILAFREEGATYRLIAKRFGIHEQHVYRIVRGKQRAAVAPSEGDKP